MASVESVQVTGLTATDINILQKNVDMILSLCDSLGALQTAITNTNSKLRNTGMNKAGVENVSAISLYADTLGIQLSCMAQAIEQLQPKDNSNQMAIEHNSQRLVVHNL